MKGETGAVGAAVETLFTVTYLVKVDDCVIVFVGPDSAATAPVAADET
jgi:hypothetical protein